MKLQMLVLADYASKDTATQKLNILGVFSKIHAKEFPVKHRRMVIVAKIVADYTDTTDNRNLAINLSDEDGLQLIELKTQFHIPHGEAGHRPDFDILWEVNFLEFPHEGYYQLVVSIDSQEIGTTSVELIKSQQ